MFFKSTKESEKRLKDQIDLLHRIEKLEKRVSALEESYTVDKKEATDYPRIVREAFDDLTVDEMNYLGRNSKTLVPIIQKMVQTISGSTRVVSSTEDLARRDGMMRGLEYLAEQSRTYDELSQSPDYNPITGKKKEL